MATMHLFMVVELITIGTGSGKALLPGQLSLCSTLSCLVIFANHIHLRFEELLRHLPFVHLQHHFTASTSIKKALLVREEPLTHRPDPKVSSGEDNPLATIVFYPPPPASPPSPTTIFASPLLVLLGRMSTNKIQKILLVNTPEPLLSSPPFPLPMERDDSLALLPSVCFNFLIGLLSCGVVSSRPEDATESTLVFFVDEVWISRSHYVTIFLLPDVVVKASPTHSSIVSNLLSFFVEDLSCLVYLCIVFSVYGQREWIILSFYCKEEV
ncbi:hypothetical protein IGI04_026313 [Brassica rapa subsp. trilocularis]|uniref:Uncharacterized protein n=1 Tax=Brassica rapa subsp. trilocularis TaxID=1813537 RepID=A0ABQ7KZK5_BRACM|nr:hypothetical protein IGI04_026313 [Brassica rapa subsp. trilocularis]